MFEKRLRAFGYAVGMTWLILIAYTFVTYCWFLLYSAGAFANWFVFNVVPKTDIVSFLMKIKLIAIIFGSVFITCWIWQRRLARD